MSVATADFDELLTHLPFSQEEKQKVLQGELVTVSVKESENDELAVMLAFLVKTTPDILKQHFIQGQWIALPEAIITDQKLTASSTIKDLSKMKFSLQESSQVSNYLSVQNGNDLNLSASEIKQFQSIKPADMQSQVAQQKVEEQLHDVLINRFQAYRTGGNNAIAPYQREQGKQYFLGNYFKKVTLFDSILQQYYPLFYKTLSHYPLNKPQHLKEGFFALKLEVEGAPAFALMHRMLLEEGDAIVVAMRHFYATQSYNGEQDLGLFIPVKEGVLVLGLFRTSSDAVAGFGSGVKHAIGRRLLASSLSKYYEHVQKLFNNK